MKHISVFLILATLPFLTTSQENVKYFKWYTYNKKGIPTGIDNISEETAKDTICYKFTYNENNKPIKNEHLKNILYGNKYEAAITTYKYDKKGNLTKECNYSTNKKWKEDYFGIAIKRYKYDDKGNKIEESYYGTDKKLKENIGAAICRWKYDDKENKIEESYYGTDKKLKGNRIIEDRYTDIAIYRWKYDDKGYIIEKSRYDANEKLIENKEGIAICRWKYDENGKEIETSYYGADENLKEKICYKYDKYGIITEIYEADKKLKICYKYDDKGKLIEESFYNVPENLEDSIAIRCWKFDDKRNIIEASHYGTDGKLKGNREGIAIYRFKYYDNGRKTERSSYDANEKLIKTEIY